MQLTRAPAAGVAIGLFVTLLASNAHAQQQGDVVIGESPAPAPPSEQPNAPAGGPATAPAPDTAAPAQEQTQTQKKEKEKEKEKESVYDVTAGSELATYADNDHVFVVSPSIVGSVSKPASGWSVSGSYLVDVVSAASVDIVSTASRRFVETRQAGGLNGAYQLGKLGLSANGSVSIEPDYAAYAGGGSVNYDLFDKNFTALLAYYHGYDIAGRHDTPWNVWNHQINTDGVKLGGTIILDRATYIAIVGDLILENGDTSKPYRYVPMFAPGTVVTRGESIANVNRDRLSARALEQLPTDRQRYALSARFGHRFGWATLRLDERLYTDAWGLRATTTDGRFIVTPTRRLEVGPHVRLHAQGPVDFWQRAYTMRTGLDFPALRTGDRELGPLVNITGGATARVLVGPRDDPRRFVLGLDANLTSTSYLDDIYISQRTSEVIALIVEMAL